MRQNVTELAAMSIFAPLEDDDQLHVTKPSNLSDGDVNDNTDNNLSDDNPSTPTRPSPIKTAAGNVCSPVTYRNALEDLNWVPDKEMKRCYSCGKLFTIVRRRHHCRLCGKLFCAACSSNTTSVGGGLQNPKPARTDANGTNERSLVRVCNKCYVESPAAGARRRGSSAQSDGDEIIPSSAGDMSWASGDANLSRRSSFFAPDQQQPNDSNNSANGNNNGNTAASSADGGDDLFVPAVQRRTGLFGRMLPNMRRRLGITRRGVGVHATTQVTAPTIFGGTGRCSRSNTQKHNKINQHASGQVGWLYVCVVEAVGVPAADSLGTSDPYCKLQLSGTTSFGQEWDESRVSTVKTSIINRNLNPKWDETFAFAVPGPSSRAELRIVVYDHDTLVSESEDVVCCATDSCLRRPCCNLQSPDDPLGECCIPLSELMDMQHHNRWINLSELSSTNNTDANKRKPSGPHGQGRLHLRLQFRFSMLAEFVSNFSTEQVYIQPDNPFNSGELYKEIFVLLDYLLPVIGVVAQIVPVLAWEHPSLTFLCFACAVALCLYVEWLLVVVHVVLIIVSISQCLSRWMVSLPGCTGQPLRGNNNRSNSNSNTISPSSRRHSTYHIRRELHQMAAQRAVSATDITPTDTRAEQEEEHGDDNTYHLNSAARVLVNSSIPSSLREVLKTTQNSLTSINGIIHTVCNLFTWQYTTTSAVVLLLLCISCAAHVLLPNRYIVIAGLSVLFMCQSSPWRITITFINSFISGISTIIRAHAQRRRAEALLRQESTPTQ